MFLSYRIIYIVGHLHFSITNYRVQFIWLGMTSTADGTWIWDDGTQVSDARWYVGEFCKALEYIGWQNNIYNANLIMTS